MSALAIARGLALCACLATTGACARADAPWIAIDERELRGPAEPLLVDAANALATGNTAGAIEIGRKALRTAHDNRDRLELLFALSALGEAYRAGGRCEAAGVTLERALAQWDEQPDLNPLHPARARLLAWRGDCRRALGAYAEAGADFRAAGAILAENGGGQEALAFALRVAEARLVYAAEGRSAGEPALESLYAERSQAVGAHPATLELAVLLLRLELESGRAEAEARFREALDLVEAGAAPHFRAVAEVYRLGAAAAVRRGEFTLAAQRHELEAEALALVDNGASAELRTALAAAALATAAAGAAAGASGEADQEADADARAE